MRIVLTVLVSLMPWILVHAQVPQDAFYGEAIQLRDAFPTDAIVARVSQTTYEYQVDRQGKLTIKETENGSYLAVRSNAELALRAYSNNVTLIQSHSLLDQRKKKVYHDTYCGHNVSPGIFYSDGQVCVYETRLSQVGQLVEYESNVLYTNPMYLAMADFIDRYPAKTRKIVFQVPDAVQVEFREFNFTGYRIEKKEEKKSGMTITTYTLSMAPGYPKDDHTPAPLRLLPHVLILCKEFTTSGGQKQSVLATTDDLYRWYSSLTGQLNNDYSTFKPLVDNLTKSLKTPEEKMRAIYYWVQDNIKYIAFEDGVAAFKPADARDVYFNRYGDCKGMANLTKAMMTLAGLDARLTWVGTDRIPYTYDLPTIAVDNHMICTVYLNGKEYLLDATEKSHPLGEYAERIQGKQVLIEDGAKYHISTVPVEPLESTKVETTATLSIHGTSLDGKGATRFHGEAKRSLLQVLPRLSPEEQRFFTTQSIAAKALPGELTITGGPNFNRDSATWLHFDLRLPNRVFQNNNELYVDLEIDKAFGQRKMPAERKVPYWFDERVNHFSRVTLQLPEGYRVKELPPPLTVKTSHLVLDLRYTVAGNQLVYTKVIQVPERNLPTASFDEWNEALVELNAFYNHSVILVK